MNAGDTAPDFTLTSSDGNTIHLYQLLELGPVVLFFYLKAFTPVCIAEVCSFRDHLDGFSERNATVLGISSDSAAMAERFRSQYRLQYPLLIDENNRVRALYGIPKVLTFIPGRSTFVIAKDKKIAKVTHSQLSGHAHVTESLRSLGASA